MTVEREEPGQLIACCDECGTRQELDVDVEAGAAEISATLAELGWLQRKPDRVRYPAALGRDEVVAYPQDTCPDCQTDEAKPQPRFGRARKPAAILSLDDPVDEWPRSLIWAAMGLRPACGHPRGGWQDRCPWCHDGFPVGTVRPAWAR